MADGDLIPTASTSAATAQERFLRLAFAAADLLLELGPEGTIRYAAGAFNAHFGAPAAQFLGENISRLIAPADGPALATALAEAHAQGRSAPSVLHLANAARASMIFAALATDAGLSVTIGRLPAPVAAPAAALQCPATFRREAEMRLATGADASLTLLDLGEDTAHHEIAAALATAPELADGSLFGTLAPGRFGVISRHTADLAALSRRIETLPAAAGQRRGIRTAAFKLTSGALGPARAARALRSALLNFASGGMAGLAEAGFSQGLEGFLAQATERAGAVQRSIAGRHFRLVFQPIVGLADRAVHHYEALLRPIQPAGARPVSTQEFVTFVEAAGLSEELDQAVLEEALSVLRAAPAATVAVNLSGLSLQNAAFQDRLLQSIRRSGLEPGRLLVELTETAEIENVAAASGALAALRAAGVPVCLDDFGAGAAAFRYLRDFRVDFIKIDGAYVHAALKSPRERAMLASMAALARDVEAKVVAEMIETPEQEALCQAIGAGLGQGWLYGKPGLLPGLRR